MRLEHAKITQVKYGVLSAFYYMHLICLQKYINNYEVGIP